MANTLDSTIQQIVARAASEIADAVRANIVAEVSKVAALQVAHKAPAAPAPAKRKPGRPAKAKPAAPAPAPAKAAPAKAAKAAPGKKRRGVSQDELDTVLAFIAKNPGKRSEEIRKALGMPQDQNSKVLAKLRELKKVKTKGEKRATTYSV